MPRALAKTQEYTVDRVTCKSMYRHADQWSALLQAFLSHIVERYGLQMVREWKFSSIALNYAYLSYYPNFSVEEYYEWYRVTYSTLKEFDGKLQFGGPVASPACWTKSRQSTASLHLLSKPDTRLTFLLSSAIHTNASQRMMCSA